MKYVLHRKKNNILIQQKEKLLMATKFHITLILTL
jgi:hypothetical protein